MGGENRNRNRNQQTTKTTDGVKLRIITNGVIQMHSRTPRTKSPTGGAKIKVKRSRATDGESWRTLTVGGASQHKIQTTVGDLVGEVIRMMNYCFKY